MAFRQGRFAVLAVAALAIGLVALEFPGQQGAARIGAGLIALLVTLRMIDTDESLVAKGFAFIVIGTGFLAFSAFVSRRRASSPGGSPA